MKCSKMKTNYQEALPILSSARLNLRGLVAKAKVRLIDFIKRFSGKEREIDPGATADAFKSYWFC